MTLLTKFRLIACCMELSVIVNASTPLFLRSPSVGASKIVFSYSDQLWSVSQDGGIARQLTTGPGIKKCPYISPNGKWVAYTNQYEGLSNVYLMPLSGGMPRRLTFTSAGPEEVVGWTPDSMSVVFRSPERSPFWFTRLFTISIEGGLPNPLPFPEGVMGSFASDGLRIAYVPMWSWGADRGWKDYRGGRTARIWIAQLSDSKIEPIPRENSNDFDPMWSGKKIYFLSDRNGPVTIFSYDLDTHQISQLISPDFDIEWATAAPGLIVYEQLGTLHKLNLNDRTVTDIKVEINSDLPALQPHFLNVSDQISNYNISPTGIRALFEAHGEIFTVPADKGEVRDLTNTPGVAERDPAWSPDGRWIAYFSDESGEYALHLRSQDGVQLRKINLGQMPSFFYAPHWSPDSENISYTDARLNFWYVNVGTGVPVKIDTDYFVSPGGNFDISWSPDSRWIAYTKQLPSHVHALFLFSLDSKKVIQITRDIGDVRYPVFDHNGKYLYFTVAADLAQAVGWLDLSSFARPVTRNVYVLLLRGDLPYPFIPESDEEKVSSDKAASEKVPLPEPTQEQRPPVPKRTSAQAQQTGQPDRRAATPSRFRIDFQDIDQRMVPLPLLPRNYTGLEAGSAGMVYLIETPLGPALVANNASRIVFRYEMDSHRFAKVIEGVSSFLVSADGSRAIYTTRAGRKRQWNIARLPGPSPSSGADLPPIRGEALKTDDMIAHIDPRQEWAQIYREAWRLQRDFFYDPHLHGLNWSELERRYREYADGISCREDLNYLLTEIFGQLGTSHVIVNELEPSLPPESATGFLGADFEIQHGHYRIKKIYKAENWSPDLRSPLLDPGVGVTEGDYILAVNGRELHSNDSIFEFLQGTSGKPTALSISSDLSGGGSRTVLVVPLWSDKPLRAQAWIDANRQMVYDLSGGRIGYIPVPDTRTTGYKFFNHYFFTQLEKDALIVDDRFNHGGLAPDYMVDVLKEPVLNYWFTREGHGFSTPMWANIGPKALLINMYAGSGGDALAWYFQHEKLGPLVGTRTWGGIDGTYDYPQFIDGGELSTPELAPFDEQGKWIIENRGVPPDVEIEIFPEQWREGRDPQLEKAVEILLQELKQHHPQGFTPPRQFSGSQRSPE